MSSSYDPQRLHEALMSQASRELAYTPDKNLKQQKKEVTARFKELLGWMPAPIDLDPQWGEKVQCEGYTRQEVSFAVEADATGEYIARAPGWLLVPDGLTVKAPAVICLQGHTSGAHISVGIPIHEKDAMSIAGDRDFAVQAVKEGYVALAFDQRNFGKREDGRDLSLRTHFDPKDPFSDERCRHQSMVALMLGRTMQGERVWDVIRAVDLLETVDVVDQDRIACMGNSGGGSVSFHAACVDERIAAVMPSCSFCDYASSIGSHDHCCDNYLPGALRYFDMGDLAMCISPRPMVIVSGVEDPLFPIQGVREQFETVKKIYHSDGKPQAVTLVEGDGGHRFYSKQGWQAFRELTGW